MVYKRPAFAPTSLKFLSVKVAKSAFTVVELLVVIVVIGVLAAITVVSYNGITQRATVAKLVAQLNDISKSIEIYSAINGTYPAALEDVNDGTGLPVDSATLYTYTYDNDPASPSFCLIAKTNNLIYSTINNSPPILGSCTQSGIVGEGLVMYYDAANTFSYSAGASWRDIGGSGFDGVINSNPVFSSQNDGILTFDGVDDWISIGKKASEVGFYDQSYTMSAAFKVADLVGDKMIFSTASPATTRTGLHHGTRNASFYFGHYGADASGGTVVADTWYIVHWVYNKETVPYARIYVNGILTASSNAASFIGETNFQIARTISSPFLKGSIGYISIYNRALSLDEISQNFNVLRGRYGL